MDRTLDALIFEYSLDGVMGIMRDDSMEVIVATIPRQSVDLSMQSRSPAFDIDRAGEGVAFESGETTFGCLEMGVNTVHRDRRTGWPRRPIVKAVLMRGR